MESLTSSLSFCYYRWMLCPYCSNEMKYRSSARRIVRYPGGKKIFIQIWVYMCCGHYKRDLPTYLVPFKHYTKDVIEKVKSGEVSSKDILYEDYPCEMTMLRWRSQN